MEDYRHSWPHEPRSGADKPRRHRIHIFGPSGAGTSTLGRLLADRLATQHFDTDDFYWVPTDPPFRTKRPVEERRALMQDVFLPRSDWILSGSLDSWSEGIAERFTLAILLQLDPELLLARLERRERQRYGAAMEPGGAFHEECSAFMNWAAGYERGARPGRSRARHEAWAAQLACPVLRLAADAKPEALAEAVLDALAAPAPRT
ncbi:MAG: AAA family ATPase [Pseudomonadota bacterium]